MLYGKHKYLVSLPATKASWQIFKDKIAHIEKSLKFVLIVKINENNCNHYTRNCDYRKEKMRIIMFMV